MVLLDYPDSEGVTRELVIGYPRRLVTGKPLLALGISAAIGLAVILGSQTVLRSGASGPAPDIRLPVVPFPSVSASPGAGARRGSATLAGTNSPPATVSLRGTQLTPSVVPGQAVVSTPAVTSSATASSAATSAQQAVTVTYLIVAQADGGFQFEGEVRVVNNGSAPISGWQISVALPLDRITAFAGADGYISNHILLMQPGPGSGPVEPGQELSVFFAAEGPETTPQLCAFDNTTCG